MEYVHVFLDISAILIKVADPNVSKIQIALPIEHASIINALILVLEFVAKTPDAMLLITYPCVVVLTIIKAILSLCVNW